MPAAERAISNSDLTVPTAPSLAAPRAPSAVLAAAGAMMPAGHVQSRSTSSSVLHSSTEAALDHVTDVNAASSTSVIGSPQLPPLEPQGSLSDARDQPGRSTIAATFEYQDDAYDEEYWRALKIMDELVTAPTHIGAAASTSISQAQTDLSLAAGADAGTGAAMQNAAPIGAEGPGSNSASQVGLAAEVQRQTDLLITSQRIQRSTGGLFANSSSSAAISSATAASSTSAALAALMDSIDAPPAHHAQLYTGSTGLGSSSASAPGAAARLQQDVTRAKKEADELRREVRSAC